MLRALILWRVSKTTYLTAFLLAFVLLMIQIFRLGFILFGLPPSSSVPFFMVWFAYYSFFFLPDGLIVATSLAVYELKDKKLLHILYSFCRSPWYVFKLFLYPAALFFILCLTLSFFMFEEHVSFASRGLFIQYKDRIFETLPEKIFFDTGDVVIYIESKEGDELRNLFLRYKNLSIIAERAKYEGKGRFVFSNGSLLTKERGKYFLMEFDRYWLDTEELFSEELRKKRIEKEKKLNIANSLSVLPFFLFAFFGTLKLCRTYTQTYYLTGLWIVLHQLIIFGLKVSL